MLETNVNKLGCCIQCDNSVYEAVKNYPISHALAGRIAELGPPKKNLRVVTTVLTDGSQMTFSMCDKCVEAMDIPKVWAKMLRSWRQEQSDEFRNAMLMRSLTPKQKAQQEKWLNKQIKTNRIVGILHIKEAANHG